MTIFGGQISPVVEKIIFLICGVSGGLYGQLAVYPQSIQLHSFVYHIFVASFKSQVSKPEALLEILVS